MAAMRCTTGTTKTSINGHQWAVASSFLPAAAAAPAPARPGATTDQPLDG
jgi:hypothetical protein